MTARKRYGEAMAATLKEWSAQIAELQARARGAGGEQRDRIGPQVAALRQLRADYAERLRQTRDTSEAVFRDMRLAADRMAAEFCKTYAEAASLVGP